MALRRRLSGHAGSAPIFGKRKLDAGRRFHDVCGEAGKIIEHDGQCQKRGRVDKEPNGMIVERCVISKSLHGITCGYLYHHRIQKACDQASSHFPQSRSLILQSRLAHLPEQKTVNIGRQCIALRRRAAHAMPGLHIKAQQDRLAACGRRL